MNRRILVSVCSLFIALLSYLPQAYAADMVSQYVEGTHYKRLPISVETADANTIEVVEVFSYMCVHCFNFDPYVEAWKGLQDDTVKFQRIPAVFSADWEVLAQAFYTGQTLGVLDKVHTPMFEGLHVSRVDLRQAENLQKLFNETADVSEDDFATAHGSFSVRSRVQQAKAKTRAFQVTGVPSMIVNGKYLIDGKMAGGNAAMLQVVDHLVALERNAAAAASAE